MSASAEDFYSEERWQNWLDRLRDETIDPDDEESARLLLNLQDDVAIAVAKILRAYEADLDNETAISELAAIRNIVLGQTDIDDEETVMLVDTIQLSLLGVFASAERYIMNGITDDATVIEYLRAAADEASDEEFDEALDLVSCAGTQVIDGADLDMSITGTLEYGHVTEWINGLDSLRNALSDPEVIEEESVE